LIKKFNKKNLRIMVMNKVKHGKAKIIIQELLM